MHAGDRCAAQCVHTRIIRHSVMSDVFNVVHTLYLMDKEQRTIINCRKINNHYKKYYFLQLVLLKVVTSRWQR
jgi:hypothetical protein